MAEFNDKIVLVTGASRGFGYAVAREFGIRGAHVIAVARTVGGLEDLDDEIQSEGGQATLVPADVTDDPALERMGAAIFDRWGRLDYWVHTAIYAPSVTPVEHIDAKDLDRSLAIGVRATQRLIRVLDPLLRQGDPGEALFLRDPEAERQRFHGCYGMAKSAQLELARSWGDMGEGSAVAVRIASLPSMGTALRGRFYPGLASASMADPKNVASRLVMALRDGSTGTIDLTG